MTTLVIGANGLVGSNVLAQLVDEDADIVGTYHSDPPAIDSTRYQVDITVADNVRALFEDIEPSTVVNCAAMTDVDACEQIPDRANAVNKTAAATVAELSAKMGADLAHFSTDYVFSGDQTAPYTESDQPNPKQVYGKTKLSGEKAVFNRHPDPVVLRPSFVYGIHRATNELTGFPAWVRDQLQAGEDVPLFTDQHVSPTRAGQLSSVARELLETGATGLFHTTARGCLTPFEFGTNITALMGLSENRLVQSLRTDLNRDAPRPVNSCLAVDKVESVLGRRQPTVETDLESIATAF